MRTRSACRCSLCQLETALKQRFDQPSVQEEFVRIVSSSLLLSGFPSTSALTAHLRSCRSNGNGNHPADPVLLEILQLRLRQTHETLLRDILLLAFIPVLHTASRQLTGRYPQISPEDTLQHLVIAFIDAVNSPKLLARDSYLAFSISRTAKRDAFAWAARQSRIPGGDAGRGEALSESPVTGIPESLERVVLLHHFLNRCQRERLLTGADIELLVHIKLEGNLGEDGEYSNALRQKIKRLLQRLRASAQGKSA